MRRDVAIAAGCFGAFAAHAWSYGDWIVDDAGISFAYARNLALGHGLVSHPAAQPVEGYSNLLWVALLAPFFRLGLFDPVLTPKLLAGAFALLAFAALYDLTRQVSGSRCAAALALLLLAGNPAFAVWAVSGLENALTAALVAALARSVALRPERPAAAGALAALLALCRPEGAAFALLYPLRRLLVREDRGGGSPGQDVVRSLWVFAIPFGAFLAFRVLTFGALLPNTFHAPLKASSLAEPDKLLPLLALGPPVWSKVAGLFRAALGPLGPWTAILLALGLAHAAGARRLGPSARALALATLLSLAVYVVLPADWMPEFRFATPFLVLSSSLLCAGLRPPRAGPLARRVAPALALAVVLASAGVSFASRARRFPAEAPISLGDVVRRMESLAEWARELGIEGPTLLCPDAGGAFYAGVFEVVDLGGLADPVIARTLERDGPAFREYVFGRRRPILIETHGLWTWLGRLERDPRFRAEYAPIVEYEDPFALRAYGESLASGVFVRRSAIARDAALAPLQARLRALPRRVLAHSLGLPEAVVGTPRAGG